MQGIGNGVMGLRFPGSRVSIIRWRRRTPGTHAQAGLRTNIAVEAC